ncbi:MAG: TolC family protein [Deltaproteobacteria bacterium]|nr:TolC family protein [Deltaproteobacteria bacterium]
MSRITAENAERSYQNARHGLLPSLSVNASYGLQSFKDSSQGDDVTYAASFKDIAARELPSQSVGLNLSMPWRTARRPGRRVMSQSAALTQAKINLETAERNIAQQVTMNIPPWRKRRPKGRSRRPEPPAR